MPAPIVGPVTVGKGGVQVVITPPLSFIQRQSGALGRALRDLDPLWDRIENTMAEIEREQFETHGHGEWPPLAESTLREKARLGYPADPMIRTGALRDALVDPANAAARGPNQLAWGGPNSYAGYHQDPPVAGRPPERKLIDLRVSDRQKLERDVVSWINACVSRTWRW